MSKGFGSLNLVLHYLIFFSFIHPLQRGAFLIWGLLYQFIQGLNNWTGFSIVLQILVPLTCSKRFILASNSKGRTSMELKSGLFFNLTYRFCSNFYLQVVHSYFGLHWLILTGFVIFNLTYDSLIISNVFAAHLAYGVVCRGTQATATF